MICWCDDPARAVAVAVVAYSRHGVQVHSGINYTRCVHCLVIDAFHSASFFPTSDLGNEENIRPVPVIVDLVGELVKYENSQAHCLS